MSGLRVAILAGGTGGHVFPGLAVADELLGRDHRVWWIGSSAGRENQWVREHGLPLRAVPYESPRGRGLARAGLDLARAFREARRIVREVAPSVLLGMGGYASVPAGLAGRCDGRPLVVHEQNAVPGRANRLLARLARRVLVAHPGVLGRLGARVSVVGNPVRGAFSSVESPEGRIGGREGRLRLLVLGGSQGARFLNERLPEALGGMPARERPLVTHQCGAGNREAVEAAYRGRRVECAVHEFIDDMARAMGEADLLVGRSGAATLAEASAAGLGALLVPYPHAADGHQLENARHFAQAGAGVVVPQEGLDAGRLREALAPITRAVACGMAVAARRLNPPGAAGRIADACEEAARAA